MTIIVSYNVYESASTVIQIHIYTATAQSWHSARTIAIETGYLQIVMILHFFNSVSLL